MGVNLRPFLMFDETWWDKYIKMLSLFCWGVGGCMYAFNLYDVINWTLIFPLPNGLCYAAWSIHVAVRLFSMWMPMALIFVHYKMQNHNVFLVLYIFGAVIAIVASLVAAILIADYAQDDDHLREQFFTRIREKLKDDDGFPAALVHSTRLQSCCSWYGPTDFFEQFEKTDGHMGDKDFTDGLASCYGHAVEFNDGVPSTPDDPKISGCGQIYRYAEARLMNFIILATIMICLICPVFIVLIIISYMRMGTGAVTPMTPMMAIPYEAVDQSDGAALMSNQEGKVDDEDENAPKVDDKVLPLY